MVIFDNFVKFYHYFLDRFAENLFHHSRSPAVCLSLRHPLNNSLQIFLIIRPKSKNIFNFCIYIWILYIYLFINVYVVYHSVVYYNTYIKI